MKLTLRTDHPIATDSLDHNQPLGTAQDNTQNEKFIQSVIRIFGTPRYLDLGCAGGWFVRRFVEHGYTAAGIDGSDYSKNHGRAEWPAIPNNLFTADLTKPFQFYDENGYPFKFNIISCFDVLEHIPEHSIDQFLFNITQHLDPGGYLTTSIATYYDEGYHVTVKPYSWWKFYFSRHGFEQDEIFSAKPGEDYGRLSDLNITLKYTGRTNG